MTILAIILRAVFLLTLAIWAAAAFTDRVPQPMRRHAGWAAVGAPILLVILRIVLRVTVPEEVPSFSG